VQVIVINIQKSHSSQKNTALPPEYRLKQHRGVTTGWKWKIGGVDLSQYGHCADEAALKEYQMKLSIHKKDDIEIIVSIIYLMM
jgi:hypothetical protein